MKLQKICLMLALGFVAGPILAGVIAQGKISTMSNTASNEDQFALWVTGTGPCVIGNAPLILFKPSVAVNAQTFKRAYAAALLAFSLDKTVLIHNNNNDQCDGASYIQIQAN